MGETILGEKIVIDADTQLASQAELHQIADAPEVLAAEETIVGSEVSQEKQYTFTLPNGEVVQGTARDMGEQCPAMKGLSQRQIEVVAQMQERGQKRRAERTEVEAKIPEQHTNPKKDEYRQPEKKPEKRVITDKPLIDLIIASAVDTQKELPFETLMDRQRADFEAQRLISEDAEDIVIAEATQPVMIEPKEDFYQAQTPIQTLSEIDKVPIGIKAKIIKADTIPLAAKAIPGQVIETILQPPIENKLATEAELPEFKPVPVMQEFIPPKPISIAPEIVTVELPKVTAEATKETPLHDLTEIFIDDFVAIFDQSESVEIQEESAEAEMVVLASSEAEVTEIMPETIQQQIIEYQETAEPEELIILESLTIFIASAIAQLEELNNEGLIDGEKIAEAEVAVADFYDELLRTIGVTNPEEREELIKTFISEIRCRADEKSTNEETSRLIEEDEATHEYKRSLRVPSLSQNISAWSHQLLGRFTLNKVLKSKMVAASGLEPLTSGL